jgi:hypothetical protein
MSDSVVSGKGKFIELRKGAAQCAVAQSCTFALIFVHKQRIIPNERNNVHPVQTLGVGAYDGLRRPSDLFYEDRSGGRGDGGSPSLPSATRTDARARRAGLHRRRTYMIGT